MKQTKATGGILKALISFLKSRDGQVALATLVLLGVVSHFSDPYNAWINLLARVGNVLVFLYILWRAGGSKLFYALKVRGSDIEHELGSLLKRKVQAEQSLIAIQDRVKHLNEERQAILDESLAQAEIMKAAILEHARAEAETILEHARHASEYEAAQAASALRERMADEIINAVEASLQTRLDAANHGRLIDKALEKVVLN